MSGLGAPSFTITPTPTLASSAFEPLAILPLVMKSSMPLGDRTSTSKVSPSSTRLVSWPTVPLSSTTLWPVAFSNSGTSATTTCLKAPVVSTLISAAVAVGGMWPATPRTAVKSSPNLYRMRRLLLNANSEKPTVVQLRAADYLLSMAQADKQAIQAVHVVGGGLAGSEAA